MAQNEQSPLLPNVALGKGTGCVPMTDYMSDVFFLSGFRQPAVLVLPSPQTHVGPMLCQCLAQHEFPLQEVISTGGLAHGWWGEIATGVNCRQAVHYLEGLERPGCFS